jgi:ABC-type phosphate/phosphonate transport system permease subunit
VFLRILPEYIAFLTAVLLTPKAKAAKVKVAYSLISLVIMFVTSTAIPIFAAPIADNLARVSSESLIPNQAIEILVRVSLDKIRSLAAFAKLIKVSLENFRVLNFSKVSAVCL